MQLDSVTAEIRPRSDWEAVDLGLALVRRDFWRCYVVWWLALFPVTVLAGWWLWNFPSLWLLLFWWAKPFGSRLVLFEMSRRLFGERPSWKTTLCEIPKAYVRRFFYRLVWARFSPWLPVTLAVEDLEGLRGKAYKQRCNQVTRRGDGVIMWIYLIADLGAVWFGLAILVLLLMCIPTGQDGAWSAAAESWDSNTPFDLPLLIMRTVMACLMLAISLMDVFITGAGFGIYLNNRTWIEGWDVELAFKRLARRLNRVVVPCLAALILLFPVSTFAVGESDSTRLIREVKAQPEFKVHTVKQKVPVPPKSTKSLSWLERLFRMMNFGNAGDWLGKLFVVSSIALLVGLTAWLIWLNRHAFLWRRVDGAELVHPKMARVVMGMDVSPGTLPDDVPGAVMKLWNEGLHQEALSLLYRGAISKVMALHHVGIQESDTEGDCLRRVTQVGESAHPRYFHGITLLWMNMAYARRTPRDEEIELLCRNWPFVERSGA